jgi:uncharacterized protein involved in outer membrane biogenesis
MFRRQPFFFSFALLLCALLAAGSYWLLTLDLNQYRRQLEARFSQSLQRPVSLGAARLRIWQGLAVEFDQLRIGAKADSASHLSADQLRLRLDGWALLQRQLLFRKIQIDGARISLVRRAGDSAPLLDPATLAGIGIESLLIQHSELAFEDARDPARPFALELTELEGELEPLGRNRQQQLRLAGRLAQAGGGAPWSLSGSVQMPTDSGSWGRMRLDVEGSLQGLAATALLRYIQPQLQNLTLQGGLNLQGSCRGEVGTGLQLSLNADGEGLSFSAPPHYQQPRPWPALQLSAGWFPLDPLRPWRSLQATAPALGLTATAHWSEQDNSPWLQLDLSSAAVPVRDWLDYLPDQPSLPALTRLRQSRPAGTVQLQRMQFAGPATALTSPEQLWTGLQGQLTLRGGSWPNSPMGELQDLAAELQLQAGALRLEQGRGRLLGGEVRFGGQGQLPWNSKAPLQLQAQGQLDTAQLLPLLPDESSQVLDLQGPATWKATLEGTGEQLRLGLEAELREVAAGRGDVVLKSAAQPGRLQAAGILTRERWELSNARLELPQATLQLQGEKSRALPESFRLGLRIDDLDLAGLRDQHPLLGKLRPEGKIGLQLNWSATPEGQQRSGELTLRQVSLQLGSQLAPLQLQAGRIRLDAERAVLEKVTARLGKSPIRLQGELKLGDQPQLELQLRAERLRANELIFPSPQAQLHKVDARLRIDRSGIEFVSAKTRLEGGTEATVSGRLDNFAAPEVRLEIEGDRVEIAEVIALWRRDPDAAPPPPAAADKPKPLVQIRARARSGNLYGLPFTDAEGQITLRDGILTIEPLSFHSGPGYGVAHVALVPRREGPSLLKISGHAEDFDAAGVYQQLLRRKGLVSGALRADFYLEGTVGKTFLATANGGASFAVRDGILNKFQALGKVFSLLNVSQLLTLRLPDMASEGMPFDRLAATLALRNGIVSSEDLVIDSNAMNLSLVGSIDLPRDELDLLLGVKPLGTVDKIVTSIPIAGWLLAGEEKALITAHFQIRGHSAAPVVTAIPISSLSKQVLGIFQRVLGLPSKMLSDVGELLQQDAPVEKPKGRQQ